jgi:hypothetical protein
MINTELTFRAVLIKNQFVKVCLFVVHSLGFVVKASSNITPTRKVNTSTTAICHSSEDGHFITWTPSQKTMQKGDPDPSMKETAV